MLNSKRFLLISLISSFLLINGCISSKIIQEKKGVQYYRLPLLSNETLENKINEIKNLLKENKLSENKKETAIVLLNAYERLNSINKGNSTEQNYRDMVQLLFDTLISIEQQYFYDVIVQGDSGEKKVIENYLILKRMIYQDYFEGDFEGVISGCNNLIARFGENGLMPDLGIILVEVLSKNNQTSDALIRAKNMLETVETKPDLVGLLYTLIELEIESGNIENAKLFYEKLLDNINERKNIFQKAGDLISRHQDEGSIDDTFTKKITKIDPKAEQIIDNVKKLISQKDFAGARLALVRWRISAEEGPEVDMIEELLKSVDKVEEKFNNENRNDKLRLDDARKLIEKEKYEEGLHILEPILMNGENYEAEKLKNQAIEKLINREKTDAGFIFRAAMEEKSNIQRKKELLLKAKSILINLIDKYPNSLLLEIPKKTVLKIDNELMKIDDMGDQK